MICLVLSLAWLDFVEILVVYARRLKYVRGFYEQTQGHIGSTKVTSTDLFVSSMSHAATIDPWTPSIVDQPSLLVP